MSKQDFERLAHAVRNARNRVSGEPCGVMEAVDKVIEELAGACSMTNPRFDRARFLRACDYGVSR